MTVKTLAHPMAQMVEKACISLRLQRSGRAVGRHFDDTFRHLGINARQFSLLMFLNRPSSLTVSRLAELLAMDRTTTTAILKPLAREGLLTICRDSKDARVRNVALTGAGRTLLAKAVRRWKIANDAIAAKISVGDLAHFHSILEKIVEGINTR